ncbi:unnamed protein product [Ectocarpus fasciculatus]
MAGALGATKWAVKRSLVCQSCMFELKTTSGHNLVHVAVRKPRRTDVVLEHNWTDLLRQALLDQPFKYCPRCPNNRENPLKTCRVEYPTGCPANLIIALHHGRDSNSSTIPPSLDMAGLTETSDPPVSLWYDLIGVIHERSATSRRAVAWYTRRPGGTWTGYYSNGRVVENQSDYDVLTAQATVLHYAKRG